MTESPTTLAPRVWQQRTTAQQWLRWCVTFMLTAVTVWCTVQLVVNSHVGSLASVLDAFGDLGFRMLPPALDGDTLGGLWGPLLETIHMATLGTLLAFVMAVPTGFCAARNVMPVPPVRWLALTLIAGSRSVNSLIWALLFVAVVGLSPVAGILAIAMRSVGFIGKLLCEAVEEIDPRPVEAMRATGAGPLQVFTWAIIPQIKPAMWGIVIMRWDINLRESTVVGLVGAGGIGMALHSAMNQDLAWHRVTTILLLILILVLVGEAISARIRRRLT